MVAAEIWFLFCLAGFALHGNNKFFPSSVAEFYVLHTQTLSPISLNLPSCRLHNPHSSQNFLSPAVFSPPCCSVLACLCNSPEGRCPNQHLVSRWGLCSAEQRARITAHFLWVAGNLGWVWCGCSSYRMISLAWISLIDAMLQRRQNPFSILDILPLIWMEKGFETWAIQTLLPVSLTKLMFQARKRK